MFSSNPNKIFAGKKLNILKVIQRKKLQDIEKKITTNVNGKTREELYRSGKEMRFAFIDGALLGLHLMLTGNVFVFDKVNDHKFTIVEMHFSHGKGIALTDRMRNANINLSPVDKKGVDALSEELNFIYLKKAFQRKTAVKNILLEQDIIRGIGNSYSDEILWLCRISPYSVAEAIPMKKLKSLPSPSKRNYDTKPGL